MELFVFGVNHTTAPVDVRERWSLSASESRVRLKEISGKISPSEHLILSTCNRTEFYSRVPRAQSPIANKNDPTAQRTALAQFYEGSRPTSASDLEHFYLYREQEAVKHLFRVAGGLDSMIVGESEILHQIKQAYSLSREAQTTGSMFHRLFPAALNTGKRVRATTDISKGCITPGQAALKLARNVLGDLGNQSVLVIGSGKISTLTAKAILDEGIESFELTNRTPARAHKLLEKLELECGRSDGTGSTIPGASTRRPTIRYVEWEQLPDALARASLVVSSTGSTMPIVDLPRMEEIQKKRAYRPLVAIDLAIPRDFHPRTADVEGVQLFNIDDLNTVIQDNVNQRLAHLPKAEDIVREQTSVFVGQMSYSLRVEPIIRHVVERFEEIRLGELQTSIDLFPPELHARLDELTRSLTNKLLHFPISRLKALRNLDGLNDAEIQFLRKLFAADP